VPGLQARSYFFHIDSACQQEAPLNFQEDLLFDDVVRVDETLARYAEGRLPVPQPVLMARVGADA